MKNLQKVLSWIDKSSKQGTVPTKTKAPAISDLVEILGMTSLVLADDDDGSLTFTSDQSSYVPYLNTDGERLVLSYLFSVYDSFGKSTQQKIKEVILSRASWYSQPHFIDIVLNFHHVSLATEVVKTCYAHAGHLCTILAQLMLENKVIIKEWVAILDKAPNRFKPNDPVELAAYPWLAESRRKDDNILEALLNKLKK